MLSERTAIYEVIEPQHLDLLRREGACFQRKAMILLGEMFKLKKAFQRLNVPHMFVKGPVIGLSVYQQYNMRSYRDIDVLVSADNLEAAYQALQSLSYTTTLPPNIASRLFSGKRSYSSKRLKDVLYEANFVGPNPVAMIDLHWRMLHDGLEFKELSRHARTIQIKAQSVDTLTAEAHFIVICAHAAKHRWERLYWLLDIATMLETEAPAIDWDKVCEVSRNWQLANVVKASVVLASSLLGASLSEQFALSSIEPEVLNQVVADANDLLHVGNIQRRLPFFIRRSWRLGDTKSRTRRLSTAFTDLMTPNIATFSQVRLPEFLFGLNFFLSPWVVIGNRIGRAFRRLLVHR